MARSEITIEFHINIKCLPIHVCLWKHSSSQMWCTRHNILWRHYREYNYHNKSSLFSSARTSDYPVCSFIVMLNIIRTKATMSATAEEETWQDLDVSFSIMSKDKKWKVTCTHTYKSINVIDYIIISLISGSLITQLLILSYQNNLWHVMPLDI